MAKPPYIPRPKAKTLVQQQSDFTAEGSPPPGKVAPAVPATSDKLPPVATAKRPGSHKRQPVATGR